MTTPEPETETIAAVEDEVVVEAEASSADARRPTYEIEGLDAVAPDPGGLLRPARSRPSAGARKRRPRPPDARHRQVHAERPHAWSSYFPNKLHQQLIREPLVTVDKAERFDIFANLGAAAPPARPARCASPSPAR